LNAAEAGSGIRRGEEWGLVTQYEFACLQDDGRWLRHPFRAADDDDAIGHVLRARPTNECALYRRDFLLATFDASEANADVAQPLEMA